VTPVLPKLLTTNLEQVDPHGSFTTSLAYWGTLRALRNRLSAMEAEGWYHDPYGRHEARWLSEGTPTDLVRDGNQMTHDTPPPDAPQSPLVPWYEDTTDQPDDDLRRADSLEDGSETAASLRNSARLDWIRRPPYR
jgi:hypothetical protein